MEIAGDPGLGKTRLLAELGTVSRLDLAPLTYVQSAEVLGRPASDARLPALHAARRTDIALVAFGDFPMADALRPAITVVDHPGHEIGRVAAARLLARLADPELPAERIQVPARIIERGSGELAP